VKTGALTRLLASSAPTEAEVKAMPQYKQLVTLANQLVGVQGRLKAKLASLDAYERPVMRQLVTDETGLDFSTLK
jgi:hypothetical protein